MKKPLLKLTLAMLTCFAVTSFVNAQTGTVTVEQNKDINKLLEFKKDLRSIDAFIIQIYNGPRGGAEAAKSQATSLFPDWTNTIEFESPNYKIWVGKFRTRLEADRALMKVKKSYADAFILQPKKNK